VDRLEGPDRDLDVDLRGSELGVAERLLDVAHVGPALEHQGCHGVAEEMAASSFSQLNLVHVITDQLGQRPRREAFSHHGEKHHSAVGLDHQLGPDLHAVLLDPGQRPLADRGHPILLALALTDQHRAALVVDVMEGELGELLAPDSVGSCPRHLGEPKTPLPLGETLHLLSRRAGLAGAAHPLGFEGAPSSAGMRDSIAGGCRGGTASALRPDAHDRVRSEGSVLLRELLECLEKLLGGHRAIQLLSPHDEAGEVAAFFVPLVREVFLVGIVGDEDAPLLGCTLEVGRIVGALDQLIDGAYDIPAGILERLDKGARTSASA
jgi:hypothetical protein